MRKHSGITFVELAITIAIVGVIGWGVLKFFRTAFDVWWDTKDSVDIHSAARNAVNEMTKYIRQASTAPIIIGGGNSSISFEIAKDTADWGSNLTVMFLKDGPALKREFRGVRTTMIDSIDLFYVWLETASASSYDIVGTSLVVSQGGKRVSLNKKIMLRGRRTE